MADSPSKAEPDVEQNQQSGDDENTHMDRDQEGVQGQGLGDFEVKEQDRWLPIANGWSRFILRSLCVRLAISARI
jgi:nuclear transcription Y subunit beta